MKKLLSSTAVIAALLAQSAFFSSTQANAQGTVFEVIHPEVNKGEVEIEGLSGIGLSNVEEGDERSEHEFAIGYSFTDFWKFTVAVEIANPRGEGPEVEGFELESLLLLPFGKGAHGHKDEDSHSGFTLGFYTALEIPREEGISDGAIEFGPVVETEIGNVELVGNLFAAIPFNNDEPAGFSFATQAVYPVSDKIGVGFESFGEFAGLSGDDEETEFSIGPGIYFEHELPNGHIIEPRLAVLFGATDDAADAVLSFNLEYKFGGK